MKQTGFLKHFTIIGMGSFIAMALGLLTTPIITRIVDPGEYGQYSIYTMYVSIAQMVICLGLDQALVRFFYESDERSFKRGLLWKCVWLPIVVSCALSVIVVILAYGHVIDFEFSAEIMLLLCLNTIFQITYRFSQLVVRLEYKTKLYSLLQIIHKVVFAGGAVALIYLLKSHYLFCLALATLASCVLCFLISVFTQRDMWRVSREPFWRVCDVDMKSLLKYSYPYVASMSITMLFQAIDKISLKHYCSYTEVGVYSSAMTLVHVFAIIQTTFNTLWAPTAVEHFTKHPEDKAFHQRGNQWITLIMFFVGLSLILIKDVFSLLLGSKYREAAYILPFLIFNPIMYTISETTVGGLVFMKKSKLQVVVSIGACVTNIIGNTILVPIYGGRGAAISTGLSYIVFMTLRTVLAGRYYYVDFKLKRFYTVTLVAVLYALYNTFVIFNAGSVIGYFIAMSVLALLYRDAIRTGWEEIRAMIAKRNKRASDPRKTAR